MLIFLVDLDAVPAALHNIEPTLVIHLHGDRPPEEFFNTRRLFAALVFRGEFQMRFQIRPCGAPRVHPDWRRSSSQPTSTSRLRHAMWPASCHQGQVLARARCPSQRRKYSLPGPRPPRQDVGILPRQWPGVPQLVRYCPVRIELLDAIIAPVGNVHVAGLIDSNAPGQVQLSRAPGHRWPQARGIARLWCTSARDCCGYRPPGDGRPSSKASPAGRSNSPAPRPCTPHLARNCPCWSKMEMRCRASSEM